ncbi:MAG: tRNA dihydrouridine synthase DusB [Candidatus Cloacimonetes bacterium]|nr:tRNA dihydrouridine synthase DusB [Candidatus Cloacimonadota bacterium]
MAFELPSRLRDKCFLAPLAGYTDQAFRRLCKDFGADILLSEMVSAEGLVRDSQKTMHLLTFSPLERPFGIQLFGSEASSIARAAELLIPLKPDFIDLNMGCPVKKVVKRGAGSALMKDPDKARKIVRETKQALAGILPLSVKFRSGWDLNKQNFLEFGLGLEESGADFLCLHPRTQTQMFSGTSNWEQIRALKQRLSIPLIGNGDINSPEDGLRMFAETGCDAIMIGRGALGKPWIFDQIKTLKSTGSYSSLTRDLLFSTIMTHLDYSLQTKDATLVVREIRSQFCFYTKGLAGGAELRNKINHTDSIGEIKSLLRMALQE